MLTEPSPIPVGKFFETRAGHRLHYHEAGTPTPGRPTVLMLHGSGPGASGYTNFKGNFPFLADHGYHVVVPDYLGYGLSDKPADFLYKVDAQVELLRELLAHVGATTLAIVGNSLGGWLAMHHALAYPAEVEKLIVMAPGGLEPPEKFVPDMEGLRELFRIPTQRDFSIPSMRKLFDLFVYERADVSDMVLSERLEIARLQPPEVYTTMGGTVTTPRLGEIKVPVLALWGYHDKFIPYRHTQYLLDGLPDLHLVTSNRAGHWFMIEEPELFNRSCLEFLNP
ncbi:MAG: 3-oxoacyl-ACP reductase [Bradyrhizobium sp.]|nr:3-oxoacyl-ACP reductase [Bradyrhizobium sp.]